MDEASLIELIATLLSSPVHGPDCCCCCCQADWAELPELEWLVDSEVVGTVKQLGPLSFVKVAQAGHMVPMDQPLNALQMITRFTRGKQLATGGPHVQHTQQAQQQARQQQLGRHELKKPKDGSGSSSSSL